MRPDPLRAFDPLNAEWVTIVLLGAVVVLTLTNVSSPRKWRLLAQALFRMRLGRQALREEVDLRDRTLLGLLLVAMAVLSLFGWQADSLYVAGPGFGYVEWLGVLAAVMIGQLVLVQLVSTLLGVDGGLSEHLYTGLLLYVLGGLLLLPVVALVAYRVEWRTGAVLVGSVLLGLLLLYRWFRGLWVGWGEGASVRHIILYLCAAEIMPVLLLISALR
jgi:hypothetical protein